MNMQNLMAQAQKMQRDIENKKKELDSMEFVGHSEWVEVLFTGDKVLKNVKILKEGNIDDDDKEILSDMFQIAVKDAFIKINEETDKMLGKYSNMIYPEPLQKLIDFYKKLPGIGEKNAERMALATIDLDLEEIEEFSNDIVLAKNNLRNCKICGHLTDSEYCQICKNENRNKTKVNINKYK